MLQFGLVITRETPPRAWGRLSRRIPARLADGNTPTGVGKTISICTEYWRRQKHPHGRGEDAEELKIIWKTGETPPRAWGRHGSRGCNANQQRNTPTGVGKTVFSVFELYDFQKHPHGRGEDVHVPQPFFSWQETPPRAWGRQQVSSSYTKGTGNTPTGVGKTEP